MPMPSTSAIRISAYSSPIMPSQEKAGSRSPRLVSPCDDQGGRYRMARKGWPRQETGYAGAALGGEEWGRRQLRAFGNRWARPPEWCQTEPAHGTGTAKSQSRAFGELLIRHYKSRLSRACHAAHIYATRSACILWSHARRQRADFGGYNGRNLASACHSAGGPRRRLGHDHWRRKLQRREVQLLRGLVRYSRQSRNARSAIHRLSAHHADGRGAGHPGASGEDMGAERPLSSPSTLGKNLVKVGPQRLGRNP